ncbi:aminotransferase class I/II-fold pyridoxal phosphate-dependent enzyme [Dokdonia sinensis]|uniref:Aminotransferase class I/II-fold pyridoxal phosphate-dependent enzyme n=1 Tax=Dokdonia sinensis TaxID=2479847 RepID=A0A3M0G8W3_9FLAO|nr:methionine aminotransferase [Dokdonia sinensis]RMB58063.1 aminotransferase class I/II-fold pyridoxal phosphate-dependent enzyme [Dokdonia sinensis]
MYLDSKLPNVGTTIFTVMSKMAHDHAAINLAQGFPGFASDTKLQKLVSKAMEEGHNQYAPMQGVYSLRKRITNKLNSLYGSDYHPETDVTVTAGATQAIYTIVSAFIRPDDEVIILKPAYDCYEPAVQVNGGKVVPIQLKAPAYKVDWLAVQNAITPKTKMLFINTPHNPTGTILDKKDMLELQQILDGTDIILVSDEVYQHIVFDGKQHESVARYPELVRRSFITASFGKTFHNTGWKMGYTVAPKELMQEFQKVHQFNVFSVHHPSQKAFAEYLREPSHYLGLNDFYQCKRDVFLEAVQGSRFNATPSAGTYFQMLGFSEITDESDTTFAERLTKEFKVASIPTSVFNLRQQDFKMLRFCFAKDDDVLRRAGAILCEI